MKKISLFLLSSLFSLGVMAQTTPASTSGYDPAKAQPAKATTAAGATGKAMKSPKRNASASSANASKSNLKKIGPSKKTTHHVTPVKKANTPAGAKDGSKVNPKK